MVKKKATSKSTPKRTPAKTAKTTPKKGQNATVSEKKPDNAETLKELETLLKTFEKIPKERRAALLQRAKREAAGKILTDSAIEKEKKQLLSYFAEIEDNRVKKLVTRKIDEVAFQAVLIREAKEELISSGIQKEVVNGKQHYPKENPSVGIYDKNCRAYQTNIDKLIEYLPPKAEKAKSALAALRDEV